MIWEVVFVVVLVGIVAVCVWLVRFFTNPDSYQ